MVFYSQPCSFVEFFIKLPGGGYGYVLELHNVKAATKSANNQSYLWNRQLIMPKSFARKCEVYNNLAEKPVKIMKYVFFFFYSQQAATYDNPVFYEVKIKKTVSACN